MAGKVRKAVFPVAGLGTRFLPATKSVPKEIMTLVDRPLVQYAIDEAREAGIEEFIFVTARGKYALEDYFDRNSELEAELERRGKDDLLALLRASNMESGAIAYVRQQQPLGLGHAVACARRLIGDEPVAILLPDDVIATDGPGCLSQMVQAHEETGDNYIAVMEVAREAVSSYGVIDPDGPFIGQSVRARGMVEKPKADAAPSNCAVIGRYILTPAVLDRLTEVQTGAGGEIQLTDAIAAEIAAGGTVHGFRFDGARYDCGSKAGFLQATVAFALARPDLGPELDRYLRARLG
jgi:UTP--glucose-1-phosphate uridylyltransferase